MRILEAIYDDATTAQWLREIPVIETLTTAWVHQYWIDNGQLCWRSHKDLPPAGIRSNSPLLSQLSFLGLLVEIASSAIYVLAQKKSQEKSTLDLKTSI